MDVFYLEANIDPKTNEVIILANDDTLKYLVNLFDQLISSQVQGKHVHLDKISGLDGNLSSIIIQKVTDEELRQKIENG